MIGRESLDAAYFEGVFAHDDDPWDLASSPYEAVKFDHSIAALSGRRYATALEVGCAHGVLTVRLLELCDRLLAVDISRAALAQARARLGARPGLRLAPMAFPREVPTQDGFDLVVLSEVAYYWSDADIALAAGWLCAATAPSASVLLVHYTGQTDYPQSGDGAVGALWAALRDRFEAVRVERRDRYRLDLWRRP